jgi:hypothetical protein
MAEDNTDCSLNDANTLSIYARGYRLPVVLDKVWADEIRSAFPSKSSDGASTEIDGLARLLSKTAISRVTRTAISDKVRAATQGTTDERVADIVTVLNKIHNMLSVNPRRHSGVTGLEE